MCKCKRRRLSWNGGNKKIWSGLKNEGFLFVTPSVGGRGDDVCVRACVCEWVCVRIPYHRVLLLLLMCVLGGGVAASFPLRSCSLGGFTETYPTHFPSKLRPATWLPSASRPHALHRRSPATVDPSMQLTKRSSFTSFGGASDLLTPPTNQLFGNTTIWSNCCRKGDLCL